MQLTLDIAPVGKKAIGGGLEGAERTTRETLQWSPPIVSPDRQINPVKDMADARGRDIVQNDGYATGAVNIHKDSIVGAQYRLNAQPEYELLGTDEGWAEEFQKTVEPRFNLMAESTDNWFDASRVNTLTGLVRLAVGGFVWTGEVLATAEWRREVGAPFSTCVQLVSPTRLSNPDGLPDTLRLRRGIELDDMGQPIAAHIRMAFPNDWWLFERQLQWRRVPFRKPWGRVQVIHIIEQMQPGQTRGISDMVSVLKEMRMTKRFQEVTLQNAVVNATYAAAVESELPREMVFGALGAGQNGLAQTLGEYMGALQQYIGASNGIAIDGVKMPHLFPGTKLSLKPLGTPGGVGTGFEESLLRHIAAALGLSYEQFSRDYTKTNYSSARASMGETWKYMQGKKKHVADRFATVIYKLWLEEEIANGNVPLPPGFTRDTFYADAYMREALCSCDWIGASRGQIDELKETEAAVLRIQNNLSTYEKEAARLGEDFRRMFRQRARENKMMKDLELMPAEAAPAAGAQGNQQQDQQQDEGN